MKVSLFLLTGFLASTLITLNSLADEETSPHIPIKMEAATFTPDENRGDESACQKTSE